MQVALNQLLDCTTFFMIGSKVKSITRYRRLLYGIVASATMWGCATRTDWDIAREQDDIAGYEWYLGQHPDSGNSVRAHELLAQKRWEALVESEGAAGLLPPGRLATGLARCRRLVGQLAYSALDGPARARLDTLQWRWAQSQDKLAAYEKYLGQGAASDFLRRAQERLVELRRDAAVLPDPVLRKVFRRELRLKHGIVAGGEIMRVDLARLSRLDLLAYPQIQSIEGIEAAVGLRYLRLPHGGKLASLQTLAELPQLDTLAASGQEGGDFSFLGAMAGLRVLDLSGNRLQSLSALVSLQALEELGLADNGLRHIESLRHLNRLRRLDLSNNAIGDLGPLAEMRQLEELLAGRNQIRTLEPLAGLEQLRRLFVAYNRLEEAEACRRMPALEEVDLSNNRLVQIPHFGVASLKKLNLGNNSLRGLSGWGKLVQVEKLDASGNQLMSVRGLDQLEAVQELVLRQNELNEDAGLERLEIGRLLDLSDNRLGAIDALWANGSLKQQRVAVFLRDNPLEQTSVQRLQALHEAGHLLNWQW